MPEGQGLGEAERQPVRARAGHGRGSGRQEQRPRRARGPLRQVKRFPPLRVGVVFGIMDR